MKRRIVKQIIFSIFIILLAFGAAACVQTPAILPPAVMPQTQASVRTGPALFRISNSQASMYFFGSVHLGTTDFYPLPEIVEDAFRKSENLVVEFNVTALSPMAAYMYMANFLMYKQPDSLAAHVPPEVMAKLEKAMADYGITPMVFRQMKPILADMTLSALAIKALGYDENLGVDIHFLKQAGLLNKTILELESAEEQFRIMASIPEDAAILSLSTSIDEMAELEGSLAGLISSWKTGDMAALIEESTRAYREHPQLAPVSEILMDNRNMNMANSLEELLKKPGTYFVVVGAMHFAGDGSVLDILSRRGYTVERL